MTPSAAPAVRPRVLSLRQNAPPEFRVPADWLTNPHFVYVGRANRRYNLPASEFCNDNIIGEDGDRAECIARYADALKVHLNLDPAFRDRVAALAGKALVCWCAPAACHADILADAVVWVHEWLAREAQKPAAPPAEESKSARAQLQEEYQAEVHSRVEAARETVKTATDLESFRQWRRDFLAPAMDYTLADHVKARRTPPAGGATAPRLNGRRESSHATKRR